jgi:capsule polysaccharide modification protein KpsS
MLPFVPAKDQVVFDGKTMGIMRKQILSEQHNEPEWPFMYTHCLIDTSSATVRYNIVNLIL